MFRLLMNKLKNLENIFVVVFGQSNFDSVGETS